MEVLWQLSVNHTRFLCKGNARNSNLHCMLRLILVSIYQTSEWCLSRALISYSSSGYPALSDKIHFLSLAIDWFQSVHLSSFDQINTHVFVTGYSLVWCMLKNYQPPLNSVKKEKENEKEGGGREEGRRDEGTKGGGKGGRKGARKGGRKGEGEGEGEAIHWFGIF